MSLAGRENPYVCQKCGHITNTVHAVDGTTPFMIPCGFTDCDGAMVETVTLLKIT